MILRSLVNMINRCLDPLGARLVSTWELELLRNPRPRFFQQLARKGFVPTHIIDVGAHRADWSRDAHAVFPESYFTLVEPQIEMKPYLDQFCSAVKKARWILAGAGATAGELPLTISSRPDGSTFVLSKEQAHEQGLEQRIVPVITLDTLCEEPTLPIPEVVKIDAEGFDLAVMRGAQKLMGVTELFLVEVPLYEYFPHLQTFHTMLAFMRDRGYEPFDFTEFIRRPSDGVLTLTEIAFAKRAGFLRGHAPDW